ncbi:hypothetical protein A5781_02075 [Mycobacterium sp. 852002-30065_SCH5024008]|nr:hypothetical protein A5781_02075 [Mycobacterium sp. 852002-30065_SCH5024008]
MVQGGDLGGTLLLRISKGGSDVLQVGPDLGQLLRLRAKGFRQPLHFGGVVDRVVPVLVVPRLAEAQLGYLEGMVGFGSVSARGIKRLGQA